MVKGVLAQIKSIDGRAALALTYTAVVLTALEYHWLPVRVQEKWDATAPFRRGAISLSAGLTWVTACVVGFLVIPVFITWFVHREGPRSIGFSVRGFHRHVWVYLALFAVMLPFIFMAASRPDFRATYPFVASAKADLGSFFRWEAGYLAQFVALEAFFRGYLLFTLERRFGWTAVFVMAVPYSMIHWHKPELEAYGAVVAGVVLGALALRFRSWAGGALLHGLVAVTMDSLAAHEAGLF